MTAPMVDYKIHWLKMMSVPESRAVVGRHDGINGRDRSLFAPPLTLDEWIDHYNNERTHQGKICEGRTPMQTLEEGKAIWRQKFVA